MARFEASKPLDLQEVIRIFRTLEDGTDMIDTLCCDLSYGDKTHDKAAEIYALLKGLSMDLDKLIETCEGKINALE